SVAQASAADAATRVSRAASGIARQRSGPGPERRARPKTTKAASAAPQAPIRRLGASNEAYALGSTASDVPRTTRKSRAAAIHSRTREKRGRGAAAAEAAGDFRWGEGSCFAACLFFATATDVMTVCF